MLYKDYRREKWPLLALDEYDFHIFYILKLTQDFQDL